MLLQNQQFQLSLWNLKNLIRKLYENHERAQSLDKSFKIRAKTLEARTPVIS